MKQLTKKGNQEPAASEEYQDGSIQEVLVLLKDLKDNGDRKFQEITFQLGEMNSKFDRMSQKMEQMQGEINSLKISETQD